MRHPMAKNNKIGFTWYSRPLAEHELLSCQYDGPNLYLGDCLVVIFPVNKG